MRAVAWLLLAVLVVLSTPAIADARPVIPPEREEQVQALLRPLALGDEVEAGWRLGSIAIELATIRVRMVGPHGEVAEVALEHPDYAPPDSRTLQSFAVSVVAQPPGSEAAVTRVIEAVERNDDGSFWAMHGAEATAGEPDARFAGGWRGWITDGLLMFTVLLAIAAALLVRALRNAPRWIAFGLLGVVVLGAVLRLTLAVEATLEPWSYTRFMIVAKLVYEGPATALLHPEPLFMTDVITTTVLACAIATPVPVFLLARELLGSDRVALVCAALVAALPLHIRFSHGDVSSIPSLTISALMFAMAMAAARAPSRRTAIAMLVLLPVPMVVVFMLRPPNILYASLLLVLVLVPDPKVARSRLIALALVVGAVTLGFGVPHLLEHYGQQVREGLSVGTLSSALEVIFSFEYDTLINPRFTPPGVTLLAILGAIDLARARRWRLLACLGGWLLASLTVHAYVVPKSPLMQARYHLHLVLPFVCLAACGVEAAIARLRDHRYARPILALATAYVLASPAIHLAFIRDVDLNDQREWAFVHALRSEIPAGCTIVEYTGEGAGSRFARVGAHVTAGMPGNPWTIAEAPTDLRALVRDPEACVYAYEGLPCFGQRPPSTAIAPACAQLHDGVRLHEVARRDFVSRPYDENLARALADDEPVTLRLYRVRP